MMMLFNLIFFVMVSSVGTLASPVPKPQNEIDLTRRYSGTKWTWYDVDTGNEQVSFFLQRNSRVLMAFTEFTVAGFTLTVIRYVRTSLCSHLCSVSLTRATKIVALSGQVGFDRTHFKQC